MLIALMAGCGKKEHHKAENEEMPVSVALPEIREITLAKTYPGILRAADQVDIIARVEGRLNASPYTPGTVEKGAVLFEIERQNYADAVSKALAELESAKAQRAYAESHLQALRKALEADAVSKMEVEQAESSLRQIDAAIKTAEAELNDAYTQLDYCTVTAPFRGRVAKRLIDPGSIVSQGTQLTSIFNEDYFLVDFNIEDSQYLKMIADGGKVEGSKLAVDFSEEMPRSYVARVTYVSPEVDTSTGTYALQARLDDTYGELRSGMYVTVRLPYMELDSATVVKGSAIASDQRGEYLYTVSDSNTVVYTPLTLGPEVNDTLRVVTSGLAPHTPYVTKALLKVRPGERIRPEYE